MLEIDLAYISISMKASSHSTFTVHVFVAYFICSCSLFLLIFITDLYDCLYMSP